MELSFEYTGTLGTGASPQAVHMMDNGLRFFYLDGGVVKAKEAYPDMGSMTLSFSQTKAASARIPAWRNRSSRKWRTTVRTGSGRRETRTGS